MSERPAEVDTAKTDTLSLRLPTNMKNWLSLRAQDNGKTINAELVEILKVLMNAEPLFIVIRTCEVRGAETFYTASLNESMSDLRTDDARDGAFKTIDAAYKAAVARITKLGFKLREVGVENRTETFERRKTRSVE